MLKRYSLETSDLYDIEKSYEVLAHVQPLSSMAKAVTIALECSTKITYAAWRSLKRLTCNLTYWLIFWRTEARVPIAFMGFLMTADYIDNAYY